MSKPKLVFFQWDHPEIPFFLRLHLQQHVKCLSECFEVVIINEDCDYQEICETYQPDLTLFESSVYGGKRKIKNTFVCPQIPKLGFIHSDAYCMSREAILSDMADWGVETFFSICVSMAEYIPEISDNLFVWPNFIDGELYRDYGESKNIPVLLTGSQAAHYPWRNEINRIVPKYFPSLLCPHFGWSDTGKTSRMIFGEKYARLLNASWVVPSCGTIAHEVVRKHFEIPGSKSCLIAEKTRSLEVAGFVDMQNCIFADKHDVLDKLDYLFRNLDELERIIDAGYDLVHSRHTLKHRSQIFQWFNLYKNLKPNQKIIQTSPFEPLSVVEKSANLNNVQIIGNGLDRLLMSEGDEKLWLDQYDQAETLYLRCLNYHAYMPEPKLRLALCNLFQGNAANAMSWILQPIKATFEIYNASNPDPVEWAYLIVAILCQGNLGSAIDHANQFPSLYHIELDRVRWVVNLLNNPENQEILPPKNQYKSRYSLHQLPNYSLERWIGNICLMLQANKQYEFVNVLSNSVSLKELRLKEQKLDSRVKRKFKKYVYKNWLKFTGKVLATELILDSGKKLKLVSEPIHLKGLISFLTPYVKKFIVKPINRLEAKFGYFLPYRFSEKRNDEFFSTIQKITREAKVETALIIGASFEKETTEALLMGIKENLDPPTVFCINLATPKFNLLAKKYANNSLVKCQQILPTSQGDLSKEVKVALNKLEQKYQINHFDLILMDSSSLDISVEPLNILNKACFIFLDGISTNQSHKNYSKLLDNRNYLLDEQNPCLRNGYAIFKKITY